MSCRHSLLKKTLLENFSIRDSKSTSIPVEPKPPFWLHMKEEKERNGIPFSNQTLNPTS